MKLPFALRHWSRASRLTAGAQPCRLSRKLVVEALEDRVLLSSFDVNGTTATYTASAGAANHLILSQVGAMLVINDSGETISLGTGVPAGSTGGGSNTVLCPVANINLIDLKTANDDVTIRPLGLSPTVQIDNSGGSTALTVDDSNDTTPQTIVLDAGSLTGLGGAIRYATSQLKALTIDSGSGGNYITISNTGGGYTTTLNSGTGSDAVAVQGSTGPLLVNGQDGQDAVTIGSQAPGLGGTLAQIQGAVRITNQFAYTDLVIDDSGDSTAKTATLTGRSLTGLAPAAITYNPGDVSSLAIHAGSGGNNFTVSDTGAYFTTTLDTGTGSNTVNVQDTTGPLTINGQGGNDQVTLGAPVGNTSGRTLANIRNPVTVTNTSPLTTLTVDDSGDTSPTYAVLSSDGTSGQITGQDPNFLDNALANAVANNRVLADAFGPSPSRPFVQVPITFAEGGLKALTVDGGSGDNHFTIGNTGGGYTTTLNSGTGSDTAAVQGTTGPLLVNGQDGRDTVTIGSQAPGLGGTLAQIQGAVRITNQLAYTDLVVDDSGDSTAQTATLTGQSLFGLAPAAITDDPSELGSLAIHTGSAGNNFTVCDTGADFTTTLDTTAGADQVNVLQTTGALKVIDAGGFDAITAGSAANWSHIIQQGVIGVNTLTEGTLAGPHDVYVYTINVATAGRLTLGVTPTDGSSLDSRLDLLSPDSYLAFNGAHIAGGGLLATSDDQSLTDPNPLLSEYVLPGQYLVEVSSSGVAGTATGGYTLSAALQAAADPNAIPPTPLLVGTNPQDMVEGDFNGDGIQDLAVANHDSGDVTILLGNGDATFRLKETVPVLGGDHPDRIATLDFNHDGRADLAVWDQKTNFVSILLGVGDGTFLTDSRNRLPITDLRVAKLFPGGPQTIIDDDFNHDGYPDEASLVTVTVPSGTVVSYVQVVEGDPFDFNAATIDYPPVTNRVGGPVSLIPFGAFLAQTGVDESYNIPNTLPGTPLPGDLNGDGVPDMLEVDARGQILLRLGQANQPGFFIPRGPINSSADPAREAVILSEDPVHPQVAAIALGSNTLFVLTGTVDARTHRTSWVKTFTGATGKLPVQLVAADLDGDGKKDLVTANALLGSLSIFLNQGDGHFAKVPDIKVGLNVSDVQVADLNGDGHPDLVITDPTMGDVGVLINKGLPPGSVGFNDELRFRAGVPSQGFGVVESVVSTESNQLFDQAVLPSLGVTSSRASQLYGLPLYPGATPGGELLPPVFFQLASLGTGKAVVGDFNGDGIPDLVVTNRTGDSFTLLLGKEGPDSKGTGSFIDPQSAEVFQTGSQPGAVVAGHFGGDRNLDLAVLNEGDHSIWIYRGDGHGGFIHKPGDTLDAGTSPTGLTVANINGLPDLVVGNSYGDVLVLLGQPDGTFRPPEKSNAVALAVADLKHDGHDDFIFSDQSLDHVSVQYGTGASTAVLTDSEGNPLNRESGLLAPGAVTLADLTGDGIPDLIVANAGGNNVLVYPGLGNGQFGPELNGGNGFPVGTNPAGVTVADVNGDGVPDLMVANQGSNDVSVLLGKRTPSGFTFTPGPRLQSGGMGPISMTVADVTGPGGKPDGIPDILVTNNASNNVTLLPGLGDGFFNDQSPTILPAGTLPVKTLVGDFTGNGKMDLVTVNQGSDNVSFIPDFVHNSTPEFISSGGSDPVDALVRNVSGGTPDVVVANRDGNVALLLGGSDGLTLDAQATIETGLELTALGTSDELGAQSVYVAAVVGETETALPETFRLSDNGDTGNPDTGTTDTGTATARLESTPPPDGGVPLPLFDGGPGSGGARQQGGELGGLSEAAEPVVAILVTGSPETTSSGPDSVQLVDEGTQRGDQAGQEAGVGFEGALAEGNTTSDQSASSGSLTAVSVAAAVELVKFGGEDESSTPEGASESPVADNIRVNRFVMDLEGNGEDLGPAITEETGKGDNPSRQGSAEGRPNSSGGLGQGALSARDALTNLSRRLYDVSMGLVEAVSEPFWPSSREAGRPEPATIPVLPRPDPARSGAEPAMDETNTERNLPGTGEVARQGGEEGRGPVGPVAEAPINALFASELWLGMWGGGLSEDRKGDRADSHLTAGVLGTALIVGGLGQAWLPEWRGDSNGRKGPDSRSR